LVREIGPVLGKKLGGRFAAEVPFDGDWNYTILPHTIAASKTEQGIRLKPYVLQLSLAHFDTFGIRVGVDPGPHLEASRRPGSHNLLYDYPMTDQAELFIL
jgi:hypothetical protein